MTIPCTVRVASWEDEHAAVRAIRDAVFVQEQGVLRAIEFDGRDGDCVHLLAIGEGGEFVGTGRMQADGHIGRVAVLRPWRGRGVGAAIVRKLVGLAAERGLRRVHLHAQVSAVGFYEQLGFRGEGETFLEADIEHVTMRRSVDPVSRAAQAHVVPGPLQLGSLTVPVPLFLAPMAGYTNLPFRRICRRFGCGMVFTEVVVAEGIAREIPRTMHYLSSVAEERPLAVHIYGSKPDRMAAAASVVASLGIADVIDINCGCPVPKIVRKGAGVALMDDPDRLREIVAAVRQAVDLPVTVKTRLGRKQDVFLLDEVAQAVEEGGGSALFVHARFASQAHRGPVDLAALRRVRETRAIPIVGNGGLKRVEDIDVMLRETGVAGVMVGQGAVGNPWFFEQIRCAWEGRPPRQVTMVQRFELIEEHLRALWEYKAAEPRAKRGRGAC